MYTLVYYADRLPRCIHHARFNLSNWTYAVLAKYGVSAKTVNYIVAKNDDNV